MKHAATILTLVLLSTPLRAQAQGQPAAAKLDGPFRMLLEAPASTPLPGLQALPGGPDGAGKAGAAERYGAIVYTDDPGALRAAGIEVGSVWPGFVTARVLVEELPLLAALPAVRFVEAARVHEPANDLAAAQTGVTLLQEGFINDTQYTGTGVAVCVVDSGIDWEHGDFRVGDASRVQYLWDQTLTPDADETNPAGFLYGVEYTKAQLDAALAGTPIIDIRQEDTHGHGTHVAGTAAGNGQALASGRHRGMAPEADLIVVKSGNGTFTTTGILDALSYCGSRAALLGLPVVVNLSLGTLFGPHDGTYATSAAVDAFTTNGTAAGRVVVVAAGNSGTACRHVTGTVPSGGSADITFTLGSYTPTAGGSNDFFLFNLWLDGSGDVTATVTSPNGFSHEQEPGADFTSTDDGHIFIDNDLGTNGDRYFDVQIFDAVAANPPAPGVWTLTMSNTSGTDLTYHGWLYNSSRTPVVGGCDTDYMIAAPADANTAIAVGSWVSRWRWANNTGTGFAYTGTDRSDDISSFSSIGPRRDGVTKPDITAPGQAIVSARSQHASYSSTNIVEGDVHVVNQGTSMASPVAAGCAALLLQANAALSANDVGTLFTTTAKTDAYTEAPGATPNDTWGAGRLDCFGAQVENLNGSATSTHHIYAHDTWAADASIAIDAGIMVAVRFVPTESGKLTGVFFHPSATVDLSAPLQFELWSDDGSGLPGAKIGDAVTMDRDAVLPFAWNHVSLISELADVTAGTPYHVVMYFTGVGDVVFLRHDDSGAGTQSSFDAGSGWTARTQNWRIRPVVAGATGVDVLPVELASFTAVRDGEGVVLRWETASETNNAGFEVEYAAVETRRGASLPWQRLAFVDGGGTTAEARTYTYRADGLAPGSYLFRLRQVDYDGAFTYSPEVEATVGLPGAFFLSATYPNPFNPQASWTLAVARRQRVRVDAYDALGRRVARLFDGVVEPDRVQEVAFDAGHLPSGLYFVRVAGEAFHATRTAMLVK